MREIIIADRGWVFLGMAAVKKIDGARYVVITEASVIRKWGTTKGIGQIALFGPTKETVLDECGTVKILETEVKARIECCY